MIKRLGLLLGGSLLFWGLAAYPAFLLGGERDLVFSAVAGGLCLVPALATLLWAEWAFRKTPEQYLMMVLGGTGLRMFCVLGGTLVLRFNLPYFRTESFLLWVGIFYLFTLALELAALLGGRTRVGDT